MQASTSSSPTVALSAAPPWKCIKPSVDISLQQNVDRKFKNNSTEDNSSKLYLPLSKQNINICRWIKATRDRPYFLASYCSHSSPVGGGKCTFRLVCHLPITFQEEEEDTCSAVRTGARARARADREWPCSTQVNGKKEDSLRGTVRGEDPWTF